MKRGKKFVVLGIAVFMFLLAGQLQAAEEFKLGVFIPLSGAGTSYGIPQLHGLKMAVEEINGKGGITVAGKKYNLDLIVYDDKCVTSEGVNAFEKLVNSDKVKIILGPICSNIVSALAPKVGDRVILVTIGTVVTDYTEIGNPFIFRPHISVKSVAASTVDFFTKDLNIRHLGIHAGKSAWTPEFLPFVQERFKQEGRELSIEYYDLAATNYYPQLTALGRKNPDAIFNMGYPNHGALCMKQLHELGIKPKHRLTYSSGTAEEFLRITSADILEGIYDCMAAPIDSAIQSGNPKALPFKKKFTEKFGIGPSWSAGCNSYDVVYIVAKALENAGTVTDLIKMRDALHNLGKVEETIVEYPIVNGKMFNERNEAYMRGAIRQMRKGEFQFLKWTGAFHK